MTVSIAAPTLPAGPLSAASPATLSLAGLINPAPNQYSGAKAPATAPFAATLLAQQVARCRGYDPGTGLAGSTGNRDAPDGNIRQNPAGGHDDGGSGKPIPCHHKHRRCDPARKIREVRCQRHPGLQRRLWQLQNRGRPCRCSPPRYSLPRFNLFQFNPPRFSLSSCRLSSFAVRNPRSQPSHRLPSPGLFWPRNPGPRLRRQHPRSQHLCHPLPCRARPQPGLLHPRRLRRHKLRPQWPRRRRL